MSWWSRLKRLFGVGAASELSEGSADDGPAEGVEPTDGSAEDPAQATESPDAERYRELQTRYAALVNANPYGIVMAGWSEAGETTLGAELEELRRELAEVAPSEEELRRWFRKAHERLYDLEWG